MGLTGLGKIFSQVIRQISKGLRYIGNKISHYIRLAIHYLFQYVKRYYRYLGKVYETFQKDPMHFMQFAGSLAILIYYGAL